MDFGFNKEQKLIKSSAREFLEKEFTKDVVRELEESEEGYSPELWRKIAELGWIGLNIPEDYDGMGMDFVDLAIILEETGYNLMPGPFFSTVMGAFPIIDGGSEEQKNQYLPKISMGELKLTLAFSVARLTLTSPTPFTPLRARSTCATHEAHVIPRTGRLTCCSDIRSPPIHTDRQNAVTPLDSYEKGPFPLTVEQSSISG